MLLKSLKYSFDWYFNPARRRKQVSYPTVLNFPITDNCNARCVMCDVWKEKSFNELSSLELEKILKDPLFKNIEHIGISGGEPSLVKNLDDYFDVILRSLKNLKSISITSHCFLPKRWKYFFPKINSLLSDYNVEFSFNISLDGIGIIHDEIRQIPNGFNKLLETYNLAKEYQIRIQFQSTISKGNVFSCPSILEFCKSLNEEVVFRKATEIERLYNIDSVKNVDLNFQDNSFFKDFLLSENLNSYTNNVNRRLFYKDLASRLTTNKVRKAPCKFQNEGVLLTSQGDLFLCSISDVLLGNVRNASAEKIYFSKETNKVRSELISNKCLGCIHDQSGAWKPSKLFKEALKLDSKIFSFQKYIQFIKYSFLNIK